MLPQIQLLQEHELHNFLKKKPKGTSGVLRVDEGSSSGNSKLGENQGVNYNRYEEVFHILSL